jgi:hypothetical protein
MGRLMSPPFLEKLMITLLISVSGTDVNGKSFSKTVGDIVVLDAVSEKNMIANGTAEPVKQKPESKYKK